MHEFENNDIKNDIADELIDFIKKEVGVSKIHKITYVGGDWFIKDEIIDLLVRSHCGVLVEVFGGGGAISAYAPRTVFKMIIYNDKDDLVYNFFKVLKEKPKELMRELVFMPFSRKLYRDLQDTLETEEYRNMSDVEKAALFFYLQIVSYSGAINKEGFKVVKEAKNELSRSYLRRVSSLSEMAKRWVDVVLENKDFREILTLYDSSNTVFYCDPPYLFRDYYRLKFTHRDMKALLDMLTKIRGKFVLKLPEDHISLSYVNEFAMRYKIKTIEHHKFSQKCDAGQTRSRQKTVLIYNYTISRGVVDEMPGLQL
jgi:DNA adenine methylase